MFWEFCILPYVYNTEAELVGQMVQQGTMEHANLHFPCAWKEHYLFAEVLLELL